MKRAFSILIAITLTASFISAQGFRLGLGFAGGVANIDGFGKSRLAGGGGLLASYSMNEHFGLSANLGYALKGGQEHISQTGGAHDQYDADARTTFHALNLDLSVAYKPVPKLGIGLGPYVALLLAGKMHTDAVYTDAGVKTSRTIIQDIGFQYHPIDFGVQASIAYQLTGAVALGVRFRQGIPNAFAVSSIPLTQRNQSLDVIVQVFLTKE